MLLRSMGLLVTGEGRSSVASVHPQTRLSLVRQLSLFLYLNDTKSTYAPRLPKLSLECMRRPAVKCIHLDKNLDQKLLFMWVCEAIAAYDLG
jgi:hypothetical protein